MATVDKVLSVLGLYTAEEPEWTVDALAAKLGVSGSTAYLYVRSLADAGLLVAGRSGRYTIGPAVIALDRVTRHFDPLTSAAHSVLEALASGVSASAIGLLCRIYRLQVMCVEQYALQPPPVAISYERGRPRQLLRGAASKAILAHLTARPLRRFYDSDPAAVQLAGLGTDWDEFKRAIRQLRKQPAIITRGELDPGMVGISAPVFGDDNLVLGSIGLVIAESDDVFARRDLAGIIEDVVQAGMTVSAALQRTD